MNEFKRKIMDLKTDDKDLLLNSFKKLLDDTVEANDDEFEECLTDLGRFVIALISAQRIAFKVLHPKTDETVAIKYESVS